MLSFRECASVGIDDVRVSGPDDVGLVHPVWE